MFNILRNKHSNGIVIETMAEIQSVIDHTGETSFIHLTEAEADELYVALGQELLDRGLKRLEGESKK